MLFLDKQVTVMLMDYDNGGKSLDKLNSWAKKTLTAAFGGVTIVSARGTWLDGNTLYEDKSKLYQCNYGGQLTTEQTEALLQVIKAEFGQGKQEAVSIMFDFKLAIIDRTDVQNDVLQKMQKISL